jgi:DNA-binding NarL/FixJ family response regulator
MIPLGEATQAYRGAGAPIRVLVADGMMLMRHGLRAILELAGGFEIVAEAGSVHDIARTIATCGADVALVDVDLPGGGIAEVLRLRARAECDVRVLAVGTRDTESQLLQLLGAGVCGMVLKDGSAASIVSGLQGVHRAAFYVAPDVSRKLIDRWHRGPSRPVSWAQPGVGQLSARERELLGCIGSGMANREIAARLCISVKTVEAHKAHIATKLGVRGAADLLRYAARERWAAEITGMPPSAALG